MNIKHRNLLTVLLLVSFLLSSCGPGRLFGPTVTSTPTITSSPTFTPSPLPTSTPTETPIPPTATHTFTPTPEPQQLLLRRKCGRDYIVKADEPIQIFYGGWGVIGKELADQWWTSLTIDLTIDGKTVSGELQTPSRTLPHNCTTGPEDLYWLYYMVIIPGLSSGRHDVTVTFNSLRKLPDGTGISFGPGPIATQTFRITTR